MLYFFFAFLRVRPNKLNYYNVFLILMHLFLEQLAVVYNLLFVTVHEHNA